MMKYGFRIRKSKDGNVAIITRRLAWTVDFLSKTSFEERVETVKWSLLGAGFVWTEDVEKYVRESLK